MRFNIIRQQTFAFLQIFDVIIHSHPDEKRKTVKHYLGLDGLTRTKERTAVSSLPVRLPPRGILPMAAAASTSNSIPIRAASHHSQKDLPTRTREGSERIKLVH